VKSLLDGIAGVTSTQIGNLVSPSTVLTTVSQVDPIKAYFSITEREYLQMTEGARGGNWVRKANNYPLQLTLATGKVFDHPGKILFADRQVNSQTGTILIVGSFANPDALLRPGQFGRIRARTGVQHNALLVPQRAVSELQGRYQVAVVDPANKVSIRTVEVGARVGPLWIIQSGIAPGERVVTEGTSKIRDGATVRPELEKVSSEGA
jgi:membrane fusion protein (multidrug efflux system)